MSTGFGQWLFLLSYSSPLMYSQRRQELKCIVVIGTSQLFAGSQTVEEAADSGHCVTGPQGAEKPSQNAVDHAQKTRANSAKGVCGGAFDRW